MPLYTYTAAKETEQRIQDWRSINWQYQNIHAAQGIWIETFLLEKFARPDMMKALRLIPGLLVPELQTTMKPLDAQDNIINVLKRVNDIMLQDPAVASENLRINHMIVIVALERSGAMLKVEASLKKQDERFVQTYLPPWQIMQLTEAEIADVKECQRNVEEQRSIKHA
jgi:hypothetical protein